MIFIVQIKLSCYFFSRKPALIKLFPLIFNLLSVLPTKEWSNVLDKHVMSHCLDFAMVFTYETFEKIMVIMLFEC